MADELPGTTTAPPATMEVATPPSAPATPSPVATSSATTKSVVDETTAVFRAMRDKAAPAAPSPAEPAGAAPAQAAIVPAAAGEAPPPVRGPIPYDRHQAVITNTRREAREEAEAKAREKLGWAENLDQRRAVAGTQILDLLDRDFDGTVEFLRRQRGGQTAAATAEQGPPEPDVVLADGSKFYSAEAQQRYADWREQKLTASIDGRYGPMLQEAAMAKLQAQATTEATAALRHYHTNFPRFKELEKDIKALCLQNPGLSISDAYIYVFRDKGLAAEKAGWESAHAGQLARKAAASSVQPGAAQPGTPRPNSAKSTLEITREVFARKRAAAG